MAKKRRKDKELARLRQEIEVLRAQATVQEPRKPKKNEVVKTEPETIERLSHDRERKRSVTTVQRIDPKFLKLDLIRSGVLTIAALGIIIALTFFL